MSRSGFDRHITVFSPDGVLYQVEYAFKAVTYPGLLTVAVSYKDGVLVLTQHQVPDRLMRPESVTALYNITENVGCCMTGRAPDGKALAQRVREVAADYKYRFGLPIPIGLLAKRMADKAQVRTQQAGIRPMGAVTTFIGMDQEDGTGAWAPRIYAVNPAGSVAGYFAYAAGKRQAEAQAYLEKRQKTAPFNTLTEREAAMVAISAMQSAIGAALKAADLEMGRCNADHRDFARVPDAEVEEWLTAVAEAD